MTSFDSLRAPLPLPQEKESEKKDLHRFINSASYRHRARALDVIEYGYVMSAQQGVPPFSFQFSFSVIFRLIYIILCRATLDQCGSRLVSDLDKVSQLSGKYQLQ